MESSPGLLIIGLCGGKTLPTCRDHLRVVRHLVAMSWCTILYTPFNFEHHKYKNVSCQVFFFMVWDYVRFSKVWLMMLVLVLGLGVEAVWKGSVVEGIGLFVFSGLFIWWAWVR